MGSCISIATVSKVDRTQATTRPQNGTAVNTKFDSGYTAPTIRLYYGTSTNTKTEISHSQTRLYDRKAKYSKVGFPRPPTTLHNDTASNKKVEHPQLFTVPNEGMHWRQLGGIMHGEKVKYLDLNWFVPVAMSHDGNRVVLGSTQGFHFGPVTVRVFDFDGASWKEVGSFYNRKARFGSNIALSGDGRWLAIGTELSDNGRGNVEVYRYGKEKGWEAMGNKLAGLKPYDYFGSSLSFSGDGSRIAIGATPYIKGADDRCTVKIFDFLEDYKEILKEITQTYAGASDWVGLIMEFLGNGWHQLGETIIVDQIGWYDEAVSLSSDGNFVAIGSPGAERSTYSYPGSVRVFELSSKQTMQKTEAVQRIQSMKHEKEWTQVGQTLYGIVDYHSFGFAISINAKGDIVAVGARGRNENEDGYIQIFYYNCNEWKQMGKTISIENSLESISICSNGNRIAVGSSNTAVTHGHVEMFDYNGNDWVPQNIYSSENIFGSSVSLSSCGDRLAVGSLLHRTACLTVYEFK